jgi:tRNA (mo5U34)-methyltransferase
VSGAIAQDYRDDIGEAVAGVSWYHSIALPGGIVTPGEYDHRNSVSRLPMPTLLTGKRCLDIGTHDGFWAFEMERRGADDVVAVDIDDPARIDWPGAPPQRQPETLQWLENRRKAFDIAHAALGSRVKRKNISVYDLTTDEVGMFDFAFLGTLLHHLRDPIGALMAVRRVVQGALVVCAVFSVSKTLVHPRQPIMELMGREGQPFWELPNLAGLRRQLTASGWTVDEVTRPFFQKYGQGWSHGPIDLHPRGWSLLPRHALLRFGAPHVGVLASRS